MKHSLRCWLAAFLLVQSSVALATFHTFSPANVTMVGTMQLRFTNGENATLIYTVNGTLVTKQIVRQVFSSPVPSCS